MTEAQSKVGTHDIHVAARYRCTSCGHEQSVSQVHTPDGVYLSSAANWCKACETGKPEPIEKVGRPGGLPTPTQILAYRGEVFAYDLYLEMLGTVALYDCQAATVLAAKLRAAVSLAHEQGLVAELKGLRTIVLDQHLAMAELERRVARGPQIQWVSVEVRLPEVAGEFLVTVATDDGPVVYVLYFDAKKQHWIYEGEPTFCKSYYFEPTHWAARPAPAGQEAS